MVEIDSVGALVSSEVAGSIIVCDDICEGGSDLDVGCFRNVFLMGS